MPTFSPHVGSLPPDREEKMSPNVHGKKFPYTKAGQEAAKKEAEKPPMKKMPVKSMPKHK